MSDCRAIGTSSCRLSTRFCHSFDAIFCGVPPGACSRRAVFTACSKATPTLSSSSATGAESTRARFRCSRRRACISMVGWKVPGLLERQLPIVAALRTPTARVCRRVI